jgi:hypothetical protein
MYKKLEAMGSNLLARFVPKVNADACGVYHYSTCWQCAGSQCCLNTCTGNLRCGYFSTC